MVVTRAGAGTDVKAHVELDIDSIAAGGDGVGRDESGRVVFVPLTAPGDRVRARVVRESRRWARAELLDLVRPAPERRSAPCEVFGSCGGCRLQHLPEAAQAEAKRRVVADALQRIAGVAVEVPAPLAVGPPFQYRNRVSLTLRGARAGFHALADPDRLVEPLTCLLAAPAVQAAWDALRPWDALPSGGERRVTIRATGGDSIALFVEGGNDPGSPDRVARSVGNLASYWWVDAGGTRHHLGGEPTFGERLHGFEFQLQPDVFVQVNDGAGRAIDAWLEEHVGPLAGLRVADVYSGVGARALRWASAGASVTTCEVHAGACEATRSAAAAAGLDVDVRAGLAEHHPDLFRADIVVVNPPRNGLDGRVRKHLLEGGASGVAYVSCDPATLARDLAELSAGYRVTAVQPFDAFPQTAHIETAVWLQ